MDFSYNQAINMIWYFSDKKSDDDFKMITDIKIKDIFTLIDNLKNCKKDIEQFELYDLIGLYKSELYDSRNEILLKQKKYIYKTIYSLCSSYGIIINNSNFDDFESEIKYYLLMVINRTNLNVHGQIIKYMDLTVKGYFKTYLKKYIKQNISISFDDTKYSYNLSLNNSFSSDMMKVLSSLSSEDLALIMLKYQENYNDEDLANYFNLTIDEIKEKEIGILSLLKNNNNVKTIKKSKKRKT